MYKMLIVLAGLAFFQNTGSGQSQKASIQISGLESLWKIAADNNATRKIYVLKKEQAGYDYKSANSFLYPQAGIGYAGQDNLKLATTPVPGELIGQPGKTIFLQFGKKYTSNPGLTVTKDLFDWQSLLQARIARENIALTTIQEDAYMQTLKAQIGQYYYSLLIANASLNISKKDLLLADSIADITHQRFQQGLIDAASVNTAAINYNNVKQNILQSEELKKQAIANIKILTGLTVEANLVFEETISFNSVADKKIPELGQDKSLLVYPGNIAIAQLQIRAQKAAYYPKFSLNGYFGYQQFRDNVELSFDRGAWADYRYIGINMNWPLFTGFLTSNKIKSAAVQKKITEEQYEAAAEQSKINDAALKDSYSDYWNMTVTSRNTFQLYDNNLTLSLQKYKEGLISIDTYFKSFEDYLRAENTYLTNLSSLLSIEATILARK